MNRGEMAGNAWDVWRRCEVTLVVSKIFRIFSNWEMIQVDESYFVCSHTGGSTS